jgi:hypothetical protein
MSKQVLVIKSASPIQPLQEQHGSRSMVRHHLPDREVPMSVFKERKKKQTIEESSCDAVEESAVVVEVEVVEKRLRM